MCPLGPFSKVNVVSQWPALSLITSVEEKPSISKGPDINGFFVSTHFKIIKIFRAHIQRQEDVYPFHRWIFFCRRSCYEYVSIEL